MCNKCSILDSMKIERDKKSNGDRSRALKVLIVDDLKANRLLARVILEMNNFRIFEAEDGEEAISYFQEYNPDVVFMDISMPKIDGVEAMQTIRTENKRGKKVPIIAFTSGEHSATKLELIQKGFSEYLKKPYQTEELFDKISLFYPNTVSKTGNSSSDFSIVKQ